MNAQAVLFDLPQAEHVGMSSQSSERPDGVRIALDVLRRRWSPVIIEALGERPRRYLELHRQLFGISQKVLTEHLRALEMAGVVSREANGDDSKVLYRLTARGDELRTVIAALRVWGTSG